MDATPPPRTGGRRVREAKSRGAAARKHFLRPTSRVLRPGSGFARLSLGGYAKVHLTDALACDMVATVVDDATIRYVFDTTGQSIAAGSYPNAYVSFPYDGELLNVHVPITVQPAA